MCIDDKRHLTQNPSPALLEGVIIDMQASLFPELVPEVQHVKTPLTPTTPQQKTLFLELSSVYKSQGKKPPQRFATPHQKTAFQQAAEELGIEYEALLIMALEAGRTSMSGILRYLQACVRSRQTNVEQENDHTVIQEPWVD